MAEKLQFREKLAGILKYCEERDNLISREEAEAYFEEDNLTGEQMELVFDYLLSQKIIVKGYVKNGGSVTPGTGETGESDFSEEEQQYLLAYEQDMRSMDESEPLARYFTQIVSMARQMHRQEVFIGDLIQEGNMGLLIAAGEGETDEEKLLLMARNSMEALLESQTETKLQDRRMAERVNNLDDQIKKLTEEMGRKISVDELSQFLNITEEEIGDILRLAGEEIPEEDFMQQES